MRAPCNWGKCIIHGGARSVEVSIIQVGIIALTADSVFDGLLAVEKVSGPVAASAGCVRDDDSAHRAADGLRDVPLPGRIGGDYGLERIQR